MVDSKEKMKKKIGKKFYSPYFKQMIEVVKYVDDNNWTFKLENGEVYAAKTPLSYFEEQSEKQLGYKIMDSYVHYLLTEMVEKLPQEKINGNKI